MMIDVVSLGDLAAKFLLAVVFGGAIGYERELNGKFAGLRTHALICLGATLIMHLSALIAGVGTGHVGDPARLGAQVVAGVGFLGAGSILQSRGKIIGLTTAATIWVVAAVGLSLGGGYLIEASVATIFVWVVLVLPAFWERKVRGGKKGYKPQGHVRSVGPLKRKVVVGRPGGARLGGVRSRLKRLGVAGLAQPQVEPVQDVAD